MNLFDRYKFKYERRFFKSLEAIRFLYLRNDNFSIICNNCWGGRIYQQNNLPYLTPTVGLFFYMPCYIEFLEDFDLLIDSEIQFVDQSKYERANRKREEEWYPIGRVGEIEVQFLHYKSEEEASEKWFKRIKRINKENMFVVGSERDLCEESLIRRFQKLPFKNKIFFTAKKYSPPVDNLIHINHYNELGEVGDIFSEYWKISRYFNVVKWLNQGR